MGPVCRNRIFLNKETGERRRVLWISSDAGWVYWIGMDIGASMPESEETSAILEMLERGVLEESAETEGFRFVLTPAGRVHRISVSVSDMISTHPPRAGRDSFFHPTRSPVVLFQPTRPVRGGTTL